MCVRGIIIAIVVSLMANNAFAASVDEPCDCSSKMSHDAEDTGVAGCECFSCPTNCKCVSSHHIMKITQAVTTEFQNRIFAVSNMFYLSKDLHPSDNRELLFRPPIS